VSLTPRQADPGRVFHELTTGDRRFPRALRRPEDATWSVPQVGRVAKPAFGNYRECSAHWSGRQPLIDVILAFRHALAAGGERLLHLFSGRRVLGDGVGSRAIREAEGRSSIAPSASRTRERSMTATRRRHAQRPGFGPSRPRVSESIQGPLESAESV
jgi:hypothetical protein